MDELENPPVESQVNASLQTGLLYVLVAPPRLCYPALSSGLATLLRLLPAASAFGAGSRAATALSAHSQSAGFCSSPLLRPPSSPVFLSALTKTLAHRWLWPVGSGDSHSVVT